MIRGALILGVGFTLGYAKALHDSDAVLEKLDGLKTSIDDFLNESKNEKDEHLDIEGPEPDTQNIEESIEGETTL